MESANLFGVEIDYDPISTAAGYDLITAPDPTCCDACSEFRKIVMRDMLPPAFVVALRRLGIDPAKPQEVYGTPEEAYFAGWYLFVGKLHTIWAGEAEFAFSELVPGLRCWVTEHAVSVSWPDTPSESSLVQVEFDWHGSASFDESDSDG